MRLLKDRSDLGFDSTAAVTVSKIVDANRSVIRTTSNDTLNLVMPLHATKRRGRLEGDLRLVRVVNIPDVGVLRHARRLLLESKLSISAG